MMGQAVTCSPSPSALRSPHVGAFQTQICKTSFLASPLRPTPSPSRAIALQSNHTWLVTKHLWQGGDLGISLVQSSVRTSARYTHEHTMPPTRPILVWGDANWLRQQQRARIRRSSTRSVSAPFTATIPREAEYCIIHPVRHPRLQVSTGPTTSDVRITGRARK